LDNILGLFGKLINNYYLYVAVCTFLLEKFIKPRIPKQNSQTVAGRGIGLAVGFSAMKGASKSIVIKGGREESFQIVMIPLLGFVTKEKSVCCGVAGLARKIDLSMRVEPKYQLCPVTSPLPAMFSVEWVRMTRSSPAEPLSRK